MAPRCSKCTLFQAGSGENQYLVLITSLFTDPALLLHNQTLTLASGSSADFLNLCWPTILVKFKLFILVEARTFHSYTLFQLITNCWLTTCLGLHSHRHQTIVHESHISSIMVRFLNLCWPTILVSRSKLCLFL